NAKQIATVDTVEEVIDVLLAKLRAGDENPVATMRHLPSGDRYLFSDLLAEAFLHRPTDRTAQLKIPFFAEQHGYALQYAIAPYSDSKTGSQACKELGYWHLSEVAGIRARGLLYPFEKLTIASKIHSMLENDAQGDFVKFLRQASIVTIPNFLEPSKIWGGGHMVWSTNDAYIVKQSGSEYIETVGIKEMNPKLVPSGWLCIALGDASIAGSPL
ncbi:MAG: hypothetical protein NT027_01500, partial [Proteobacteria bacterium]|nr:hypothetical protein [Pseudomonadota bacterium]